MGDLINRIEYIREGIKALDKLLEKGNLDELIGDFIYLNSILHILQTSIQSLIDIGARVASELGSKPPEFYSDIPNILKKLEILGNEESDLLRKIIGFRNIIVHQYLGVNLEILKIILEEKKYLDIMRLALKILDKAQKAGIDP